MAGRLEDDLYSHDFPSVSYHAVDQSATCYTPEFTFTYLLVTPLFHGPLLTIIGTWMIFRTKALHTWEKALRWNMSEHLCFFLFASFKGNVEVNWMIFIVFPLLIIGVQHISTHRIYKKYLYGSIATTALIIIDKLYLVFPSHQSLGRIHELHGNREFAERVV